MQHRLHRHGWLVEGRHNGRRTKHHHPGHDDQRGDTAAFCAAGEAINAKTSTIAGPDQAVTVFTELDPTLDTMLATAPAEVTGAAATFVSTARASVRSGDFTPFEDGTIDALVQQFDAVCANG